MTILANGGRNLNDRGTSKGGNLERVQMGGVTSTIQVENLGGKKVIVNRTRSLCSNTSLTTPRPLQVGFSNYVECRLLNIDN